MTRQIATPGNGGPLTKGAEQRAYSLRASFALSWRGNDG